jgi:hypothetical protein
MPLFHTTLFSNDFPGDAFDSAGVAWSFEKGSGVYVGPTNAIHERSFELFKERGHAPTINHDLEDVLPFFDMEVLIRARELSQAKQALNLLVSSMSVLEGSITFCPKPFSIEPWEVGTTSHTKSYMSMTGLLDACELANRVSRARSLTYALHKLALSYQSSSPHMMDLHPGESPRLFGIHTDPIYHVYLANAITLAYSAIEELGLEIRASQKNPSKMPDGTWNPIVKADLEARLQKSGIDISSTTIWTLRGSKTRIENIRPPPSAGKPSWSRGSVRDRNIQLIDALALASWLRSCTTTHRFTKTARSLTVYDVHNVQSLARYLIMERFGFWTGRAKAQPAKRARRRRIRIEGERLRTGVDDRTVLSRPLGV